MPNPDPSSSLVYYHRVALHAVNERCPPGTRVRWGRRTRAVDPYPVVEGKVVRVEWAPPHGRRDGFTFVIEWKTRTANKRLNKRKKKTTTTTTTTTRIGTHVEYLRAMLAIYIDECRTRTGKVVGKRTATEVNPSTDLQLHINGEWQPLHIFFPSNARSLELHATRQWILPSPSNSQGVTVPPSLPILATPPSPPLPPLPRVTTDLADHPMMTPGAYPLPLELPSDMRLLSPTPLEESLDFPEDWVWEDIDWILDD